MYYIVTCTKDRIDGPIHSHQIVGKIKGRFDENVWNMLSIQIWVISIDNLNAIALFTNN